MKENETGKNVSSGAKKVEAIDKNAKPKQTAKKTTNAKAKATKSSRTTKRAPAKSVEEAIEKENEAARERVDLAKERAGRKEKKLLKKAELKQAKLERRAELKEKKLERRAEKASKRAQRKQAQIEHAAQLKAKREEAKAQRIARREMLAHETKAERQRRLEREKKERVALSMQRREAAEKRREQQMKSREAKRERRAQNARHKREQKSERKNRTPGFGGWLAAVISLGVACLALTTIVTAGAMQMNNVTMRSANNYRATLFEMVSVSEDMDNQFSKLRVSTGVEEQRRLLTDILVDAALMESALEKMPIDTVTSTDISAFVNKTGSYARNLLSKLAAGKSLNETEIATVNYLHQLNAGLYGELNTLATHMSEREFMAFIDGQECEIRHTFDEIGKSTRQEPQEIVDAPFSQEGNVGKNMLTDEEVSESKAKELALQYLNGYHVVNGECTGETVSDEKACYNFVLTCENGAEIFAQISKAGGKLMMFNTYEECSQKNFDLQTCDTLAREFLSTLGMKDVEAVWLSDGGMVADITYVGTQDGVRIYSELIRVRVCESKGVVVGMDASNYLVNHKKREIGSAMSAEEAREKLSSHLTPYAAHLALIPVEEKEVLCYEFGCTYGEDEYIVYLDAVTGEEVQIYRVRASARGSWLR